MDWMKLFNMQSQLDQRINYEGTDRLEHKFSALLVETAEAWNETRDFKFWSKNYKTANVKAVRVPAMYEEGKQYYNPLLDELSDMHHFIMSIGIELEALFAPATFVKGYDAPDEVGGSVSARFKEFTRTVQNLEGLVVEASYDVLVRYIARIEQTYEDIVYDFLAIVETLGFTGEDLERAYYEKNKINFARQANGY